jgi:hypothetical protein
VPVGVFPDQHLPIGIQREKLGEQAADLRHSSVSQGRESKVNLNIR